MTPAKRREARELAEKLSELLEESLYSETNRLELVRVVRRNEALIFEALERLAGEEQRGE